MIGVRAVFAVLTFATIQMALRGDDSTAKAIYDELVCGTTNTWCVSQTGFREVSNTNIMRLAMMETDEARGYGREWLRTLAALPIPTNTSVAYRLWLGEKSAWLRGSGRRYLDAGSTNLWYAVADALGRLRDSQKSESEIRRAYQPVPSVETAVNVVSGFPAEYYEEMRVLTAQDEASAALGSVVVNWFGRYGLPKLAGEERANVCSNLIRRARLTDLERTRLENCLR